MIEQTSSDGLADDARGFDAERSSALLTELSNRLAESSAAAFAEHLGAARRDLKQLHQRASDPDRRELYDSGYRLLGNGALVLLDTFRDYFRKDVDGAIAELTGQGGDAWSAVDELMLVDEADFERDLAIGKLAASAAYQSSQQLTALARRVAALLGLKRLDAETMPLAPRHLFSSFRRAAGNSWAGEHLSLVMLETFGHYISDRLPGIYSDLNSFLVDNGVLEDLTVLEDEASPPRSGDRSTDKGSDVFEQLTGGLFSSGASGNDLGVDGSGGFVGFGGDRRGEPSATSVSASAVLNRFLSQLTDLQRGVPEAAQELGLGLDGLDPATTDQLKLLEQSPMLAWLRPRDTVTVELVAKLFDSMFDMCDPSQPVRAALGRLQVPVLKVALMDKGFFSQKDHPARQLLDLIVSGARGWSEAAAPTMLEAVRRAVDGVNASYDDDPGVFAEQAERLKATLQAADDRAQRKVSTLVKRLEQRDRSACAGELVEREIARRCDQVVLPDVVKRFVDGVWRKVLRRAFVVGGERSEAWRQALETLDELIWSVKPKIGADERGELMKRLPGLLTRLPAGMRCIGKGDEWNRYLDQLLPLHMSVIKRCRSGAAGIDQEAVERPDTGAHATEEQQASGNAEDPGVAAKSEYPGSRPRSAPDVDGTRARSSVEGASDSVAAAAERLAVEDWVSFDSDDGRAIALRTVWTSQNGGLCLLIDRDGEHPRVLTRERLANDLRAGTARILRSEPLTERAVADLLAKTAGQSDGA